MQSLLIDDKRTADVSQTARTFAEGIMALHAQRWDLLLLDHDLGDFSGPDGGELTGYDIACWLEEFPQFLPEKIIIVSDNSVGRENIIAALKKYYRSHLGRELSGRLV